MDLARASSKFANTRILYWDLDVGDWQESQSFGALQVFDRFVTERTFGQKKRIMLVAPDCKLDPALSVIKLEGSEEAFMVEKYNEDVRFSKLYSYIYLIHEAPFLCNIYKSATTINAAGVKITTGETLVERNWVDIDRFTGAPSKKFEDTEYTVTTMTFPKGAQINTDYYIKLDNGDRYNVDEVYTSLDLIGARGKRIGF